MGGQGLGTEPNGTKLHYASSVQPCGALPNSCTTDRGLRLVMSHLDSGATAFLRAAQANE